MTEEDWQGKDYADWMISFLKDRHRDSRNKIRRKLRLFECACCRRIWDLFPTDSCRQAVQAFEELADSKTTWEDVFSFREAIMAIPTTDADRDIVQTVLALTHRKNRENIWRRAACAMKFKCDADGQNLVYIPGEDKVQCDLIRDIFGNPFRSITLDPRWQVSTVVDLAQVIYDERAFDRMPILADALMDAGCDNDEIIQHCRGPGPHVKGCWVVDLLLGKE